MLFLHAVFDGRALGLPDVALTIPAGGLDLSIELHKQCESYAEICSFLLRAWQMAKKYIAGRFVKEFNYFLMMA
jgi:hypothetical protein